MNFLKKIDEYVFSQIDLLKNNEYVQNIYSFFDDLSEVKLKIFKIILTFLFFSLPLLFVSYFFYENYLIKNDIKEKKELLYNLSAIVGKKNNLGDLTKINKKPLSDIQNLEEYLRTFSSEKGYAPMIKSFKREDLTKSFKKIEVKIKFSQIDSKLFYELINYLKNNIGFLVKKIECEKKDDLLEGYLELVSFGA